MHSPASERNKQPILEALQRLLPVNARVLELACGSLQHARHFAAAHGGWEWQPTDINPQALAHTAELFTAGRLPDNLHKAVHLNAITAPWPVAGAFDAVYAANLLHISEPEVSAGLFAGAASVLKAQGQILLYGPFTIDGEHTSESNREFDADLRARNPRWGIREIQQICAVAAEYEFSLKVRLLMPANNFLLVFTQTTGG